MSPIESKLYEAMCAEGLTPVPQYCVQGYFVDFAFPDLRLAIEADGAAYHSGEAHERDRKRDWILQNAGWSVKRFHGSTINARAGNCAYVIRREVESARSARAVPPAPAAQPGRPGPGGGFWAALGRLAALFAGRSRRP